MADDRERALIAAYKQRAQEKAAIAQQEEADRAAKRERDAAAKVQWEKHQAELETVTQELNRSLADAGVSIAIRRPRAHCTSWLACTEACVEGAKGSIPPTARAVLALDYMVSLHIQGAMGAARKSRRFELAEITREVWRSWLHDLLEAHLEDLSANPPS